MDSAKLQRMPAPDAARRMAQVARASLLGLLLCWQMGNASAATITVVNANAPGVGFNDPTPATPVGGNAGTTLGAQRLIAFQHVANIWGAHLESSVPIRVRATFEPLACSESSAVLGSAGAEQVVSDFRQAPRAGALYPTALASKLAGTDLADAGFAHLRARFNSRLGLSSDCLPGVPFYLGLDNNHGDHIDLVAVLLHELGHGLGFQTFTSGATGEQLAATPSIWDFYLVDNRSNRAWADMTAEERRLSAIGVDALVWNGPQVNAAAPQVLAPQSVLGIDGTAAGAAAGSYDVGDAQFGPPLTAATVRAELMALVDRPDGTGLACTPLNAANALAVRGRIALIDRGECTFVIKARMLQQAGALGMVLADNLPGPAISLPGVGPDITIPSVRISYDTEVILKAALVRRSRTGSGVFASLGADLERLSGADRAKRVRMYTPDEFSPGSSVSHFSTDARPNLLMEPAINTDLSHEIKPPRDLTLPLLRDIGW